MGLPRVVLGKLALLLQAASALPIGTAAIVGGAHITPAYTDLAYCIVVMRGADRVGKNPT